MILIDTQTNTIQTPDNFQLHIRTHLSQQPKGIIIYYHGGGLIAGSPHDLSDEAIQILTQHFHLVEAPYRLAPESNIGTILNDAFLVFDNINKIYPDLPLFTFGRSSGGYLSHLNVLLKVSLIYMVMQKWTCLNSNYRTVNSKRKRPI